MLIILTLKTRVQDTQLFGKNSVVTIHDDVEVIVKDGVRHSYESLFSRLRNDIRDAFNESTRETELIGSLVGDDMWGFLGRDIMTGMGGADYFHLTNSSERALERHADQITDFDTTEGDKIMISAEILILFQNSQHLKSQPIHKNDAMRDVSNFVYDQEWRTVVEPKWWAER